ncbi:unnamed protein product [Meganyctiphanes norvegica]|uniref:Uncharacterized protein n=1 Tax=Meganyctiphanes norvegica TaxID=48144 RepID=A0AAV2SM40_MEGNR
MSKLFKYGKFWKEKSEVLYKWRVMINKRDILVNQIRMVEIEQEILEEASEDCGTLEYWKKELEGDNYRKLLRENVAEQIQFQKKCKVLNNIISSISMENEEMENPLKIALEISLDYYRKLQDEIATKFTENSKRFAYVNKISPDEICEDIVFLNKKISRTQIGDSEEQIVTLQKKISRAQIGQSDEDKWPEVWVKPTTTVYGYTKGLKEKTVQDNEEISKPVVLKSCRYWKKVRKKKSPRTLMGRSAKVMLQQETENNYRKCEKVQQLKWPSHRKTKKKKIKKIRNKKTPSELCQYISELQKFTTFPFMKGKEINSAATTNEFTYKDGKFKFKYTILVSLFCM